MLFLPLFCKFLNSYVLNALNELIIKIMENKDYVGYLIFMIVCLQARQTGCKTMVPSLSGTKAYL